VLRLAKGAPVGASVVIAIGTLAYYAVGARGRLPVLGVSLDFRALATARRSTFQPQLGEGGYRIRLAHNDISGLPPARPVAPSDRLEASASGAHRPSAT
jgi:hypothetical protein